MWINTLGRRVALSLAMSLWAGSSATAQSPPAQSSSVQSPLSAIDWLSESVRAPLVIIPPQIPSIADNAASEDITVTRLDVPTLDAVGLLPTSVTGFPKGLWGRSSAKDIAIRLATVDVSGSPAMQDLLYNLLLAELDAPEQTEESGLLFLTRIDRLLDLGAVNQAGALLERAGPDTPDLFRRWFDVALLTGTENAACDALRTKADIAPTFPARIFCLARNGDWNAAALTLETAKVLGFLSKDEDALLARFLDPELFEGEPPLVPPARPTPLVFRMFEAIGEPLPSAAMPRAFAHSDLRYVVGWKAQIEAAERLARSGAIDTNLLLGLYTERLPAASGGIWTRVETFQRFDVALRSGNPNAVTKALPPVWSEMSKVGLQVPFARIYGADLDRLPLYGEVAALAFRIGLLSQDYEVIAAAHQPLSAEERFLIALASGKPSTPAIGQTAAAIVDGFSSRQLPNDLLENTSQDRLGEAILKAVQLFANGVNGDLEDVATALALFRRIGLEDTARRAALQMLLLTPTV